MSELESFLQSFVGQGAGEEEGSFTLDYRTAFQRLRQYQLGSTYASLNCLVMSAVAAGACNVRFVQNQTDVTHTVSHDGDAPRPDELQHLFAHLLGTDESLRYLAIAVNRSLYDTDWSRATIWTPDGRFVFRATGVNFYSEPTEQFRATLNGYFGEGVYQTLARAARFAPLALYYEDKLLNNPRAEGELPLAACLKLYNPGPAGDHFAVDLDFGRGRKWTRLSSRAPSGEPVSAAQVQVDSYQVLHCDAVIAMTEDPSVASTIRLFRHGLEISQVPFPQRDGLVIFLGTEGLKVDLSSHQIVRNQDFEALLAWVEEQFELLDGLLRRAYPNMDRTTRLKAARFRY